MVDPLIASKRARSALPHAAAALETFTARYVALRYGSAGAIGAGKIPPRQLYALRRALHGCLQRLLLLPLTVVPRAALQPHDQHVIADEMRRGARLDQPPIGLVGAKGLHFLGGIDARLGEGGLGRGAEIADGRDGRAHV